MAGPQYPDSIAWPSNVTRIEHLPPSRHRAFYNSQAFTLNVTRADMAAAGYSPSVRYLKQLRAVHRSSAIIGLDWEHFSTSGKKFWSQPMRSRAKIFCATQTEARVKHWDGERERAFFRNIQRGTVRNSSKNTLAAHLRGRRNLPRLDNVHLTSKLLRASRLIWQCSCLLKHKGESANG